MTTQSKAKTSPCSTEMRTSAPWPASGMQPDSKQTSNSVSDSRRVTLSHQNAQPPTLRQDDETSSSDSTSSDSELGPDVNSDIAEDEETSSSGSSPDADSDSDLNSNSDLNINVTATPQSPLQLTQNATASTSNGVSDNGTIHTRLQTFFAQLAEQKNQNQQGTEVNADEVIERFSDSEADSDRAEEEEGSRYVQLDLALGVLSEDGGEGKDVELPSAVGEEVEQGEERGDEEDDRESGLLSRLQSVGKNQTIEDVGGEKKRKRKIEEVG